MVSSSHAGFPTGRTAGQCSRAKFFLSGRVSRARRRLVFEIAQWSSAWVQIDVRPVPALSASPGGRTKARNRLTNSKRTNWHVLITIHAKLTSAMRQQSYFCSKRFCTTRTMPLFQSCHINDIPVMDLTIKNVLIRVSDIINPNHFNLGFNMIFSCKIKHFLG